VKLPADEDTLKAIEDPSVSYLDIFPPGQPFKSLYAVYALREYMASQRRKTSSVQLEMCLNSAGTSSCAFSVSMGRALALIVSAISDHDVVGQCSSQVWRVELSSSLVQCFVDLLKGKWDPVEKAANLLMLTSSFADPFLPSSAAHFLDPPLLDRLLGILLAALSTTTPDSATKHIPRCLKSILESCSLSQTFMSAFCVHEDVDRALKTLLLYDQRVVVRRDAALLIMEKISGNPMYVRLPKYYPTPELTIFFSATGSPTLPQIDSESFSGLSSRAWWSQPSPMSGTRRRF